MSNWNVIVEEQSSVVKPGFKRMDLNDTVERNADLLRQLDNSLEPEQTTSKLVFGRPFVKRFAPMLSDDCLSVLSVCL